MTPTIVVKQVDAFTTRPFSGNSAGVVLDAAGLSDSQMQIIAREMNVSETAYLLPPSGPGADFRVRWFTPKVEVDLCGHATVACFHAAMETGRVGAGSYRLECLSGVLALDLDRDDVGPRVRLGLPVADLLPWDIATCRIAEPLGLETDDLHARLPVMKAAQWAVVPLTGLEAMRRMRPDFKALLALESQEGVGEIIVITTETLEAGSAVHVRMFAPACGIDEDPVTGAAQGPVGAYLLANSLLEERATRPDAGRLLYVAEQGDEVGRPGRIEVEVAHQGGRIRSITIAGRAVTVLEGAIQVPSDASTC
ncbi:MAG TPA: PhzF family phenazine biosynthesis protein [Patescibacteria group bacterium]|nr:PhzF family phenazine biosynthesis protein [Patescibacteria group bacterium]